MFNNPTRLRENKINACNMWRALEGHSESAEALGVYVICIIWVLAGDVHWRPAVLCLALARSSRMPHRDFRRNSRCLVL